MSYHKNWPTLLAYTASVVVFIVVAVYAVMYATGYQFDFKARKLTKTGVLAISTKPSGATVYINDKKSSRKTPLTLRNMLPGSYTVKLELADYRPFSKTIEVVSRQATEEHNLDLVLSEMKTKQLATDISKVISVGDNPIYFNKSRQFIQLNNDKSEQINIDRLPTNVKSVLKSATDIYLAKKSEAGGTWALGVVANGRKWLVVADLQDGYRGQLFNAPLNQLTAEKLSWIDSDRFVGIIGTTVYAVDLNLNKINQYLKNSYGAGYFSGKLYYVVKEANGSFTLMRDGNLFDEKTGDVFVADLPVGKSYDIVFANDDRVVVVANNAKVLGLWMFDLKKQGDKTPTWNKVASAVGNGTWYEHSTIKPKLFYTSGRKLMGYDFVNQTEKLLRDFPQPLQLLSKRDETLFLNVGNQLKASDTAGANVYDLGSINNATVLFGGDSKKVWVLLDGKLNEWTLRGNDSSIFGSVRSLWS